MKLLHLLALAAAIATITLPVRAATQPRRAWTIMVYMNAKNNLEPFALDNFHDMAQVGGSKDVNLVVELGRPAKHRYTSDDGDWSGVYRFAVERNADPVPQRSIGHLGARQDDMGKATTLSDFVRWAKANYPADHYMLVIWNHGQGWRFQMAANRALRSLSSQAIVNSQRLGQAPATTPAVGGYRAISLDEDTGSILYNSDVEKVVTKYFSAQPLDLLGFDACLMAMIETGYAFAPNTQYMVASEELEPGAGWRYSPWLGELESMPSATAEQLAKAIVMSYQDQYGNRYLTTMSAVKLSAVREQSQELSDFALKLRQKGGGEIAVLRQARSTLQSYGASVSPPLRTSVDLIALLGNYDQRTRDPELRALAARLRSELNDDVVANYASARSAHPTYGLPYGSNGIAIYFPEDRAAFDADPFHSGYISGNQDRPVAFVQDTHWPELILAALKAP